ncbi:MAG: NAD(P)/FAD-dependent oxidoreductase, partial [Planctomycetota bacterium]
DIARTQTAMQRRYVRSDRHTIQVDFYPYLAELKQARRHNRREIDLAKSPVVASEVARRAA